MIRIEFEAENNRAAAYDEGREIGFCTFSTAEDLWIITHTVVDKSYGGQGIAARLVAEVVSQARSSGRKIRPLCSYAVREFERKPEYRDVLA